MRIHRRLSPGDPDKAGGPPIASPAPLLNAGELFADHLRILRPLGMGALCATYLCRDEKAGEDRVLKVLQSRKAVSPSFTEDFLFLARSVAHYQHPGIARVYQSGRGDGEAYYVMEYVTGQPLRAWLLERLTFTTRVTPGLDVLRKLVKVFQSLQERGCYGVLKPENVFLHKTRGPVLMDFGVPGFLSPQEFEFNAHARRYLPYMAPELRRDWSNLLPQSDIYSLGALLYEILVGRAPAHPLKVLPSEASSLFSIETDEVVLKALAPKPFDRFDSLESFAMAVTALEKEFSGFTDRETPALPSNAIGAGDNPTGRETAATEALSAWSKGSSIVSDENIAMPGTESISLQRGTEVLEVERVSPTSELEAATGSKSVAQPNFEPISLSSEELPVEVSVSHFEREQAAEGFSTSTVNPKKGSPEKAEDVEPVPVGIWILLGILGAGICVLAAMLGTPPRIR